MTILATILPTVNAHMMFCAITTTTLRVARAQRSRGGVKKEDKGFKGEGLKEEAKAQPKALKRRKSRAVKGETPALVKSEGGVKRENPSVNELPAKRARRAGVSREVPKQERERSFTNVTHDIPTKQVLLEGIRNKSFEVLEDQASPLPLPPPQPRGCLRTAPSAYCRRAARHCEQHPPPPSHAGACPQLLLLTAGAPPLLCGVLEALFL